MKSGRVFTIDADLSMPDRSDRSVYRMISRRSANLKCRKNATQHQFYLSMMKSDMVMASQNLIAYLVSDNPNKKINETEQR